MPKYRLIYSELYIAERGEGGESLHDLRLGSHILEFDAIDNTKALSVVDEFIGEFPGVFWNMRGYSKSPKELLSIVFRW